MRRGGHQGRTAQEYATGAVLDALESPRVQEALRTGDSDAAQREELLAKIERVQDIRADAAATWPTG